MGWAGSPEHQGGERQAAARGAVLRVAAQGTEEATPCRASHAGSGAATPLHTRWSAVLNKEGPPYSTLSGTEYYMFLFSLFYSS